MLACHQLHAQPVLCILISIVNVQQPLLGCLIQQRKKDAEERPINVVQCTVAANSLLILSLVSAYAAAPLRPTWYTAASTATPKHTQRTTILPAAAR
jgi:hypothetical protein